MLTALSAAEACVNDRADDTQPLKRAGLSLPEFMFVVHTLVLCFAA